MLDRRQFISRFGLLVGPAAFLAGACPVAAALGELKLDARLIWGSDDDKSPNPKHKKLDTELTKKLRKIFKWKNYFSCEEKVVTIPINQSTRIQMSERCTIEVKNLGNSRVEVYLFGEGKFINRTSHTLPKGDWLTLAGDDKNETAWFIVLKQVEN